MTKKKRPVVVLKAPKKMADFIVKMKGISYNISSSPVFAAITPTTIVVDADILKLFNAEGKVKTGTVGLAGNRDVLYDVVKTEAIDWMAFIQNLADHEPDYDRAVALIQASGFGVKVNGRHVKAPFAIKNKKNAAGVASLIMKAVQAVKGTTTYEWRYSTDNGLTWIPLLSSSVANQEITGLTSGTSILASGRAIADKVASAWITEGLVVA